MLVKHFNGLSNGENLTDVSHHIKNIILSHDVIICPNVYQQRLDIDDTSYYQIDVVYYGNIFEEINLELPMKRISIYNSEKNNEEKEENNENNEEKEENIINIQTRLYQYVAIFCFFQQIVKPFLTN